MKYCLKKITNAIFLDRMGTYININLSTEIKKCDYLSCLYQQAASKYSQLKWRKINELRVF